MNGNKYAKFFRNAACNGILCAVVFGVPVAANAAVQTATGFDSFMTKVTGNSATVGFGSNGIPVVTKASASLGGTSGWSTASNFGIGRTATGVAIGQSAEIGLASGRVPLTLASNVSKAAALAGMGRMIGALIPVGNAALGLYLLGNQLDEMYAKGNVKVNVGSDGKVDEVNPFKYNEQECSAGKCYVFRVSGVSPPVDTWSISPQAACDAAKGHTLYGAPIVGSGECTFMPLVGKVILARGNGSTYENGIILDQLEAPDSGLEKYGNWATVRPKFESADFDVQKLVQAQLDAKKRSEKNGFLDWGLEVETTAMSGPAKLDDVVETNKITKLVTGADGITREVMETKTTTTQRPVSYTEDGVQIQPTEITTTKTETKNPDGSVDTKTDTETKETTTNKDQSDLCKDHPDILACAKVELDVPDDDIPKANKQITYQDENPFGTGSCPANLVTTLGTFHQTVTVWDWQKTCEYALPLRALIISLASFAAFLIVMPGDTRV